MTYFLQDQDVKPIKAPGPDMGPVSFFAGFGAKWRKAALENDANFRIKREVIAQKDTLAASAAPRLGIEKIRPIIAQRNAKARDAGMAEQIVDIPDDPAKAVALIGPNGSQAVLDLARQDAMQNPDAWKDLDLSDEAINEKVNSQLRKEYQDAEDIASMMSGGILASDLIGGFGGATADVKNLPFMVAGGVSGSLLRGMATEAGVNMAAEAAFLPSQFEAAKRLDIADPNIPQQLLMAAGAGAVLGGAIEGLRRGFIYFNATSQPPKVPGLSPVRSEAAVQAAMNALDAGDDPLEAVAKALSQTPREPLPPLLLTNRVDAPREPLPPFLLTERVDKPAAPDVPAPVEAPTATVPKNDPAPSQMDSAEAMLNDAIKADDPTKKPFTSYLKRAGTVTKKAAARGATPGERLQINPDGSIGRELKARGVTAKSAPGLFSKTGRDDLDNLVAAEMESAFPGIIDATGTARDATYLDRQGVIDLIERENGGDTSWLQSRKDVLDAEQNLIDTERGAVAFYEAMEPAPQGFFVDLNLRQFDDANWETTLDGDFDAYVAQTFPAISLTARERAEILDVLKTRGGEAEDMIVRALERDIEFAELPPDRAYDHADIDEEAYQRFIEDNFGAEPVGAGGEGSFGPDQDPIAESVGATGAGSFERTAAGDQRVIPGVAPITERQRLEQRQNSRMGGGQRGPDSTIGGLFDPDDKVRNDLFSDPTSPAAKPLQQALSQDLRDAIAKDGDVRMDAGDGKGERSLTEILDDLDRDDDFAEIIGLCGQSKGMQ